MATLALASCGKDDGGAPPQDRMVLPFPDNPDTLMANFEAAYAAMNFPAYRQTLHPAYRFLLPATVAGGGVPADFFTLAEELGSAASLLRKPRPDRWRRDPAGHQEDRVHALHEDDQLVRDRARRPVSRYDLRRVRLRDPLRALRRDGVFRRGAGAVLRQQP
jgi:hypothetical protein